MALTAQFPGAIFNNTVTGYRISACLTPRNGFQGYFYVYVCVRADPRQTPGAIALGTVVPRGTLQITGGPQIEHTFKEIDLVGVETCATHAERRRVLEFRYDKAVSDVDTFKVAIKHGMNLTVEESRLGNDFTFKLSANSEHLLAFSSRQTPNGRSGFRFSSSPTTAATPGRPRC